LSRDFEEIIKCIWESEIKRINEHLVKESKPISDLLNCETPQITTRDGGQYTIDRDALMRLASYVPKSLHSKIRVPIIFIRRIDMGRGVYTVTGDFYSRLLVKNLIEGFKQFREDLKPEEPLYLYTPQVSDLIMRFRSIFQVGFQVEL
jgi:uncharacterized protein (UPF0216 family)